MSELTTSLIRTKKTTSQFHPYERIILKETVEVKRKRNLQTKEAIHELPLLLTLSFSRRGMG